MNYYRKGVDVRYSLDELMKCFIEHNKRFQKQQRKNIKMFKENSPGAELPEHFKDDFSLPLALLSLCKEIKKIKDKMVR
jgi:hypothetical protein